MPFEVAIAKFPKDFIPQSQSDSNLILIKSLSYLPVLLPFMVSISFLIPSQSYLYFFNIFFFSSVGYNSIEVKTKYLFPLFSVIYPSTLPIIRYKGFTL